MLEQALWLVPTLPLVAAVAVGPMLNTPWLRIRIPGESPMDRTISCPISSPPILQ